MVKHKRLDPADREKSILLTAVEYSRVHNYTTMTQYNIAMLAHCSPSLVLVYFPTIEELKTKVMQFAVENEVLEIIAQGLINKHPLALSAPQDIKDTSIRFALSH
jgi:hypothetical protein